MSRKDIIIFGATGYTGQFVVRELANVYRRENISWAVAGRSKNKLVDVLKSISKETGLNSDILKSSNNFSATLMSLLQHNKIKVLI